MSVRMFFISISLSSFALAFTDAVAISLNAANATSTENNAATIFDYILTFFFGCVEVIPGLCVYPLGTTLLLITIVVGAFYFLREWCGKLRDRIAVRRARALQNGYERMDDSDQGVPRDTHEGIPLLNQENSENASPPQS